MKPQLINLTNYLDKIRETYKNRRSEYEAAAAAWAKEVERWKLETSRGWNDPLQCQSDTAAHNQKMQQLRAALENVERNAAADFAAIRKEAEMTFKPLNAPHPSQLDANVYALLQANIYSDGELSDLAANYRNNPTMSRLIGKEAEKRSANSTEMKSLAIRLANSAVNYLEPVNSAIYYAQNALRSDSSRAYKADAIGKSAAIAKIFDAEFERIFNEARNSDIFIEVSDSANGSSSAEGGNG